MPEIYPFEVAPDLAEYNVPFHDFVSSKPEFSAFVVGGFVFFTGHTKQRVKQTNPQLSASSAASPDQQPCILLLQRSLSDSYGGMWEGPGGSCEDTDATLLEALAREVLEESGLHVSHVRGLVGTNMWVRRGGRGMAIKYSFLVDVYEAGGMADGDKKVDIPMGVLAQDGWERRVKLAPDEHQDFIWATEEELKNAMSGQENKIKIKLADKQSFSKAFQLFRALHPSSVDFPRN